VSRRRVQFPGDSWSEIEALPEGLRATVLAAIARLLEEVPGMRHGRPCPFPRPEHAAPVRDVAASRPSVHHPNLAAMPCNYRQG
jgi:hypothetical protein